MISLVPEVRSSVPTFVETFDHYNSRGRRYISDEAPNKLIIAAAFCRGTLTAVLYSCFF